MFELIPYTRFRDTPSVRFFDVTIADSNARDLVIHRGPAVSPPDAEESGAWQFNSILTKTTICSLQVVDEPSTW